MTDTPTLGMTDIPALVERLASDPANLIVQLRAMAENSDQARAMHRFDEYLLAAAAALERLSRPDDGGDYVLVPRAALQKIADRDFNCSAHQHGMAAAGVAEELLSAAPRIPASHDGAAMRGSFPTFQRVMGGPNAPKDLPHLIAYACELEDIVIGAMNRADQWRFIANEMGYEPNAHKHPPLGKWLTDRIAKFRAQVATPPSTDASEREDKIILVSQLASGFDRGYQLHGLFSSFADAARHVGKDSVLYAAEVERLISNWPETAERHETTENGIWWVAARQPTRAALSTVQAQGEG